MSLDFYRNLTRVFGIMALGVLFGLVAWAALSEVKDLDLWLHLKMGEIITSTGNVPAQDILSATVAGKPWVNHEWLFQTVVYSVSVVFGMDGLLYMQSFLVVGAFLLLLLWTYRSDRQLVIIPLLFYLLQVYQTRFTVRPDIFSVLYFILFLMVLMTSMEKRWSVAALFVIEVLWANTHGFFFWGPLLTALFLLHQFAIRLLPLPSGWRDEGRLSRAGCRHLGMALGAVLLATLCNPLMFQGAFYPVRVMLELAGESRVFFKYITELQPSIDWANFLDFTREMPLKVLAVVSCVSFLLNVRRIHWGLLMLWVAMLFFAAGALRNMIYFAVVAYVATLANLSRLDLGKYVPVRFINEPVELVFGWLAKIALMVLILNYGGDMARRGYYDFNRYERKSEFLGISQRIFPADAVEFMIDNRIEGAVFNDFNAGAYLVGRAYPRVRVFIDGRTEVYGAEFFKAYRKIWDGGDAKLLDDLTQKYYLKSAFISAAYSRPPGSILKLFSSRRDWKLVYFDHDGLIFLRDLPENAALISRHSLDIETAVWPASDIRRMGVMRAYPYREVNRAQMLADMGYAAQALLQADAALAVAPACLEALKVKARIYIERGDYRKAFEYYRLALLQDNADTALRRGMALAYVGMGDYAYALEQAERLEEAALNPAGPYVRAKVFVKKKKYREAYDILNKRIFPLKYGTGEIMAVGDELMQAGAHVWAIKTYMLTLRKDSSNKIAARKVRKAIRWYKTWQYYKEGLCRGMS